MGVPRNPLLHVLERLPVSAVISSFEDGRIIWVNARNMELAGVRSPDQILGKNLLSFLPPEQHGVALRDIEAISRGESPPPVVYRLMRLDGGRADVQIASIPITYEGAPAMLSIVADITEQQRALRRLEESEERFRQLVEASPDGIVVVVGDIVRFANRATVCSLGFDETDDIVGHSMFDFIHPDFHRPIREARTNIVMRKGSMPATRVTLLRKDGSLLETAAATTLVHWDGDLATQTVMRDLARRCCESGDETRSERQEDQPSEND